jgi:hypothetical protein
MEDQTITTWWQPRDLLTRFTNSPTDGAVLTDQLGTPRGRCDEHNSKFPSVMKPKFNRPVGERNHFWRLILTGFWQGALPAPTAMWSLHITQPKYFTPTCSEVVNLTGLLKTKGLNVSCGKRYLFAVSK